MGHSAIEIKVGTATTPILHFDIFIADPIPSFAAVLAPIVLDAEPFKRLADHTQDRI